MEQTIKISKEYSHKKKTQGYNKKNKKTNTLSFRPKWFAG